MKRRLLRACLLAYPRRIRREEGDVVLALAEDLVAAGAPLGREAAGLLAGGAAARLELGAVPWRGALERLGLPLAALLLAAMVCATGLDTYGGNWLGWTSGAGLAGGVALVAGLAAGRRRVALPGAALVVAVCVLDGLRDHYGSGSRWVAAAVDVLPALLPAAVVLLACSVAPRRRSAWAAVRALAWTLSGAVALVAVAVAIRENTTTGTTVLGAAGALAAALVVRGVVRGGADRVAGALALAAAAPAGLWSLAAAGPLVEGAAAVLVGGGAAVAVAVARLVRTAGTARSPRRP